MSWHNDNYEGSVSEFHPYEDYYYLERWYDPDHPGSIGLFNPGTDRYTRAIDHDWDASRDRPRIPGPWDVDYPYEGRHFYRDANDYYDPIGFGATMTPSLDWQDPFGHEYVGWGGHLDNRYPYDGQPPSSHIDRRYRTLKPALQPGEDYHYPEQDGEAIRGEMDRLRGETPMQGLPPLSRSRRMGRWGCD
ncbi:hypothetical protein LTR56_005928 [Elasticomyces elasticus]|nr:hypothetical protein LTR22_012442 [Elasticomyces elasticus]KAK3651164.1 hypothetical protein LTR56_005928 [Elasticomyces elasticus]KAK4908414.1 hypothetical protein LTR49_022682 [Elasticomyces elasticus]KAK5741990.1 hypothetical protein LTS12_024403 [Elasticomyces elasticus]